MEMTFVRRLTGRGVLIVSGLLALVLWLGVTVLAGRPGVRMLADVSPQARFTFSQETVELIEEVKGVGSRSRSTRSTTRSAACRATRSSRCRSPRCSVASRA